jgi:hypothetical protein
MSEQTIERDEAGRFAAATDAAINAPPEHPLEGFSEMPTAPKEEPKESFDSSVDGLRHAAREVQEHRRAAQPPIDRGYRNVATGERTDPKLTLSAERAADELAAKRQEEAAQIEQQAVDALRDRVDEWRSDQDRIDWAEAQPSQKPDAKTVPEQAQPDLAPQVESVEAPADPLQRALQDPAVRQALEPMVQAAEQQRQQYVQATQAALQNAARVELAAALNVFPELQHITNRDQLAGSLATMKQTQPERFNQVTQHLNRLAMVNHQVGQIQQAQVEQAVQQQATRVQNYMKAADTEFDGLIANEPDKELVLKNAVRVLSDTYGVSPEQLQHAWHTNVSMHDPATQRMMFDAIRYRLSQERIAAGKVPAKVPPVVRPGMDGDIRSHQAEVSAELVRAFRENPDARSAARLLQARRRAAANQR